MRWVWLGLLWLVVGLTGCSVGTAGLNPYVDAAGRYQFLYPNGWVQVPAPPQKYAVVFHDLIDPSETLSLVISPVKSGKTLAELGSPAELGERLMQTALAQAAVDRKPQLLSAESRQTTDQQLYYTLEYVVNTATGTRHNLAAITTRHGQLYTLNVSIPEQRWPKVMTLARKVVNSFQVN
ncbi:MAG: photosystem II reaction center PsbP [Gloeomargarita sp. SKYBB_i_bin120]|nr:photosystem II reaction center PsbP [Gloeomargarita sp. SKYG98]MCS7292065.1 photosystem II reaction center PsbP [Gloeomargarita sp. SKYB120]MDW8177625.1 photosystem II reaction center PsbP [Gloeomargarita sp. SKYBB_i_bin120]